MLHVCSKSSSASTVPPHTYTLFLPCQQKTSTVADPLCHVERKRIWLFLERLPTPFKDSQVPPVRVSHLSSAFVRSMDILYSGLVPTHFNIRDADLHLASPNHGKRQPVDKTSPNALGNNRCRLVFLQKHPLHLPRRLMGSRSEVRQSRRAVSALAFHTARCTARTGL